MKNSKFKIILLLFGLFVLVSKSFSQIPDEIVLSIQNGNTETLANYFNQNVELVVDTHDDVAALARYHEAEEMRRLGQTG